MSLTHSWRLMAVPPRLRTIAGANCLIISCFLIAGLPTYAQNTTRVCPNLPRESLAPEYQIGRKTPSMKEPNGFLLFISVLPQYFTPEHMSALGRQLNRDFCQQQMIRAIIVDDHRAATIWEPIHLPEFYAPAERGEYYLDRATGEEYVEFSTKRGRTVDQFIKLGTNVNPVASRTYERAYRNNNFGYSAVIPFPLKGKTEVPADLEGGVLISLSSDPSHYIWLGANYNTARFNSLQQAMNSYLDWLKNDGAKILAVSRRRAHIGRLRAERITVRYKSDSETTWTKDLLLAIKIQQDEEGTIFQIEMNTTDADYSRDRIVFDEIVQSWRSLNHPHPS